jgi:hypothetical protein
MSSPLPHLFPTDGCPPSFSVACDLLLHQARGRHRRSRARGCHAVDRELVHVIVDLELGGKGSSISRSQREELRCGALDLTQSLVSRSMPRLCTSSSAHLSRPWAEGGCLVAALEESRAATLERGAGPSRRKEGTTLVSSRMPHRQRRKKRRGWFHGDRIGDLGGEARRR